MDTNFASRQVEHATNPLERTRYALNINKFVVQQIGNRFVTRTNRQSKIVAKAMIKNAFALDRIMIYSEALVCPYYCEIFNELSPGKLVLILLDDENGMEVIKKLPSKIQRQIDCRKIVNPEAIPRHFMVAYHSYRYESDDHAGEIEMFCNIWDKEFALKLNAYFYRMWETAEPYHQLNLL
jgi:hypothetical protein